MASLESDDAIQSNEGRSNSIERKGAFMMTFLAKSVADLSFGGAFAWYAIKYLISGALALGAIMLGIKLRKNKNAKVEAQKAAEAEKSA